MQTLENKIQKEDSLESRFFRSTEGNIFLSGLGLLMVYCFWIFGSYFTNPEQALLKGSFSVSRLFIGNPAGIFLGYSMGFSQAFVIVANMIIDVVVILILYPLLVLTFEGLLNIRALESLKQKIYNSAQKHHKSINKYGALGLFLFVLFPLWGTGPVVGSVIGYLMRMKPWINMSVVVAASLLTVIICNVIFRNFYELLSSYDPKSPLLIIFILVLVFVSLSVFRWIRNKRKVKA